jgi:YVTN family beta-propeller protein
MAPMVLFTPFRLGKRLTSFAALTAALALGSGAPVVAQAPAPSSRIIGQPTSSPPRAIPGGFDLPNGWRITPAGNKVAEMGDLVMNLISSPDGKSVIALHSGYTPHGLTVIDTTTRKVIQEVPLKSSWLGLSWSPDGKTLYVSGGNADGSKTARTVAPVYAIPYAAGRLAVDHATQFIEPNVPLDKIFWSGVARDPKRPVLYAANRSLTADLSTVVAFDTASRQVLARIPVGASPYQTLLSKDGRKLFVSNWSSHNVSVIDTAKNTMVATIEVGANPNDMKLSADGRLFVACSNDNTVRVIDTVQMKLVETISTSLTPHSPEGSTPNALEIDPVRKLLFVANADNNDLAVVDISKRSHSTVAGFIPTGWYPSALTLGEKGAALYIGVAKGEAAYPDVLGPDSPLRVKGQTPDISIKTLQSSAVERVPLATLLAKLPGYSHQVYANSPYNDALLARSLPPKSPSIIPNTVGTGSPIKHVIYILKENRTYDQVFGDLPRTNGDPRLTIFGRQVTPNHHALAEQFVALDNVYCDGEVSEDGHSWSMGAYATDFNEKSWPTNYGGHSGLAWAAAKVPNSGYLWDVAKRFNLTYRSYGEYASRVSTSTSAVMDARQGIYGLLGHVSSAYGGNTTRDTDNADVFIREFNEYEANYDSTDVNKRLPNVVVMSLPEDHTKGTAPGAFTPQAAVASNDIALGRIVDRVSHSKYWPDTAIFIIEDDAQDGPDHVDARRTVALAISPYIHRTMVDHTVYTTSSILRTIELLLGLPPMSQYDAAATPMYAAFGTTPDLTPYTALQPLIDINAKNTPASYGAADSAKMNFAEEDKAPMHRLNEIIWKSIKGEQAIMPAPVHRFRPLIDSNPALRND